MSFERTLAENAASATIAHNIIGDGQLEYAYADLPPLLAGIRDYLNENGIDSTSSITVECPNSAPTALLLLALMQNQYSFLPVPPSATAGDLKPTPHFCRYRVIVSSAIPADFDVRASSQWMRVEPNPQYNGRPPAPARLYLRTSGSMGVSKIVSHTQERMIGNARNCVEKYGFNPESRATIPVPVAHMYGFGAEFLPAVLAGSSIDLQEKTNLLKYLDHEKRFRPTIAFTTPAICDMLLKGYRSPRTNYHVFVTSGQRVSEELFRAFDPLVSGRLVNQYGSTEMGATAACNPGESLDRRATSIGEAMGGVELRIQPEGDSSPPGTGQLYCRHPYGFEGYVDENGDALSRLEPGGWYATGDMAVTKSDGSITVLGRADASVNRSGYLVRLHEIEQILESMESVGEVVVVAGDDETKRGQRISAFCVLRPGALLDSVQIQRRCSGLLPPYAIPDDVQVMETLPRLVTGKVDRQALVAMAGKRSTD